MTPISEAKKWKFWKIPFDIFRPPTYVYLPTNLPTLMKVAQWLEIMHMDSWGKIDKKRLTERDRQKDAET